MLPLGVIALVTARARSLSARCCRDAVVVSSSVAEAAMLSSGVATIASSALALSEPPEAGGGAGFKLPVHRGRARHRTSAPLNNARQM